MRGGANNVMLMHKPEDNERVMRDTLERLRDVGEVLHNRVLVATFDRPEQLASGLWVAPTTKKEDSYQGVVSLVVAKGPGAFVDAPGAQFHGKNVERGDWVVHSMHSGRRIAVNGVQCRLIEDAHIDMIVEQPDMVL